MATQYTLNATIRTEQGKGASRRLRRIGIVPAIIYGANKIPVSISLQHNELNHNLEEEAFYSQLITVNFPDDQQELVILRDLQRHPARPLLLHADLQRINPNEKIRAHIPLHYINEEKAPGIKLQGGHLNRILNSIDISCLPKNIPTFLEIDTQMLNRGESIHLSDLSLPAGVELPQLAIDDDHNLAVVAIY